MTVDLILSRYSKIKEYLKFNFNIQVYIKSEFILLFTPIFMGREAGQRVFRAIFLDLFLIIFVRAFLNVDLILSNYLPKYLINDFQLKISSTCKYITILLFRLLTDSCTYIW